jgi:hypothetical protein
MKTQVFLTAFGLLLSSQLMAGQCKATVSGTVINESGDSVSGATVTVVDEIGAQGLRTTFVRHETDSSGVFTFAIDLPAPGKVWLYAKKEGDGYPDAMNAFYAERDDPALVLGCGGYRSGVVVRVGPKAGYIGGINVTDADTGKPISPAAITLRRVVPKLSRIAKIDVYLKANTSESNIAIPSDVEISYEISARGYTTSARKNLNLRPSEHTDISVQLQRAAPVQPQTP